MRRTARGPTVVMLEDAGFSTGRLLRIFIGEDDRFGLNPLHYAILECLRDEGVAGATVFRGIEGFGSHREIHLNRLFAFHTDMPMLIEVVDSEEKIAALLPRIESMLNDGLVTIESVEYRRYLKTKR